MAAWVRLVVLGSFRVVSGGATIPLPRSAQRVSAFVALQAGPVPRDAVGRTIWLDSTDARAAANLRSALWKLGRDAPGLIDASSASLQLGPRTTVDLRDSIALARLAIASPSWWDPAPLDVTLLGDDLLPRWDEDWLTPERERYRQLRLHALESLCRRLSELGRDASAVQAGLAAVEGDPLRESAQGALIRAFLAEGNVSDARRQFESFRSILRDELGIEPSRTLRDSLRL